MKEINTKADKTIIYDMDKLTIEKLNNLQRDGLIIDEINTDKGIIKGHFEKALANKIKEN